MADLGATTLSGFRWSDQATAIPWGYHTAYAGCGLGRLILRRVNILRGSPWFFVDLRAKPVDDSDASLSERWPDWTHPIDKSVSVHSFTFARRNPENHEAPRRAADSNQMRCWARSGLSTRRRRSPWCLPAASAAGKPTYHHFLPSRCGHQLLVEAARIVQANQTATPRR